MSANLKRRRGRMTQTRLRLLILTIILLSFLVLACNLEDWDMDRTSDEYTGVQTRQAEGLPLNTPIPEIPEIPESSNSP